MFFRFQYVTCDLHSIVEKAMGGHYMQYFSPHWLPLHYVREIDSTKSVKKIGLKSYQTGNKRQALKET